MKLKRRKKSARFRGSRMHGRAAKKSKGKGNRGGKGMSGTGKKAGQKKTYLARYFPDYFGKEGLKRKLKKFIGINLRDLPRALKGNELIMKNYKILGDGEAEKGVIIKADAFSKQAKEKIEKAGGKAILIREKKENIKEKAKEKKK